jgi:hypothetical protein
MRKMSKRAAAITATAAIAVGGLGAAAYAAGWGVNGKASASASSSTIQDMTASIWLDGKVYPGAKLKAQASVFNPNDFPVTLNGMGAVTKFEVKTKAGAANTACTQTLNANSIKVTVPATAPKVGSKETKTGIEVPIEIDENLSELCADSTLAMEFNFTGVSS